MQITLEVTAGDFLDRLSILEIKTERIADPAKRANVQAHFDSLIAQRDAIFAAMPAARSEYAALKGVNEELWDIENDIRVLEAKADFGARFVELARAVYHTNDRRAAIKRRLDDAVGAGFAEEKEYVDYAGTGASA